MRAETLRRADSLCAWKNRPPNRIDCFHFFVQITCIYYPILRVFITPFYSLMNSLKLISLNRCSVVQDPLLFFVTGDDVVD